MRELDHFCELELAFEACVVSLNVFDDGVKQLESLSAKLTLR